ncbi:YqfO family protein [Gilvimarinus agarilyticus]|uniref:Nif3-like dinuclear metal center hexameric protein n=1 Tax=unclassified Gilvimarinus TaxID=2642066 RepID=UPI001C09042B|nr:MULTISPECIES: YqfO family protein [unclassified Gilvimarinus]MBU2884775.1 YqfO family protein [Gilvimarinus agarilyticus]MDO6569825.1 YqfO family protein [Gilvimarinus sp. 2_MG-2023]MDO6747053.1 YqfO family protein [Gilvimarinus sp. 1_MG-2023]
MYKLVFFVPGSHLESVKTAVFTAGAGCIGDYDQCCWQVEGVGQFRPLAGAQPFIGAQDELSREPEWRVETVCLDEHIRAARDALVKAHPFEEPAYDIWRLADV